MTLEQVGINVKKQLRLSTDWKQRLYDLETPKIEKQLLAEKLTIQSVLNLYQVDEEYCNKKIVSAMEQAIELRADKPITD